uniref:Uncharacterized protein n=1 Tax=Megaselia scalaris TaxID=36166 RepID=T1GV33_MEGSC
MEFYKLTSIIIISVRYCQSQETGGYIYILGAKQPTQTYMEPSKIRQLLIKRNLSEGSSSNLNLQSRPIEEAEDEVKDIFLNNLSQLMLTFLFMT